MAMKARCWGIVLVSAGILVSKVWGLPAQRPVDGTDQQPIRVEVDAVNLLVTVNHKKTGGFIDGLSINDFVVEENGVPQQITNFTAHTNLPLIIALAVDTSSSVKIKLKFEKEVAADFIYSVMRPVDQALLVEFDSGVTLLHDYTNDANSIVREIEKLSAGGGTSMYDAVYLIAEQKMLGLEGRKTIVILSDGADLTSSQSFESALRLCYHAEATIFAISTTRLGADIDHEGDNTLVQMTESTGGKVYFPVSTSEMSEAFQEINETLRNQYSITYTPLNKERDGTFRRLKVKVRGQDNIIIRHRKGYYAEVIE